MLLGRTAALLLSATALVALCGCTTGGDGSADGETVSTPQAEISGEWVVTRTVVSSTDQTNPQLAVGATSVRYLQVDRDDCGSALCPGSISSGATLDSRETAELAQVDGGFGYALDGSVDCMNAATGTVLVVDGFDYRQVAEFTVGDRNDVAGVDTASTLTGTLTYTDTLTPAAVDRGCLRDPSVITVEYTLDAVRAP